MSNSLYINSLESNSGKVLIALGIIELLLRKTPKVGFFRPIIKKPVPGKQDEHINLVLTYFHLNQTYKESYGLFYREASELLGNHRQDELLEIIISKYKALESKCDFIVCEGSDYVKESSAFEFNLNQEIAKNLSSSILMLGNADKSNIQDSISAVEVAIDSYTNNGCSILGIIINKANPALLGELETALNQKYPENNYLIAIIPYEADLFSPRLRDIVEQLQAEVLYGEHRLDALVHDFIIAAMQMQNAITKIKEDCLVITPGDRGDVIIGMLQANQSLNYPNLSGILLSTGLKPEPSIGKLIEGLYDPLPILSVNSDTYETAAKISQIRPSLTPEDTEKISLCIKLFDQYVSLDKLEAKMNRVQAKGITPKMFTYNLVQQAKSQRKHIVLPEGKDPRILKATVVLISQDIVQITLLGKRSEIEQVLKQHGIQLDLDRVSIVNPPESERLNEYIEQLYQLRKHKAMTPEIAQDYLMDVSYFGTMMVYDGDVDGMVSGAIHTTQHTIRPALQIIKTKPGFSIVSSVFFMCLEDRVLVYGDCAVNSDPTSAELAQIAIASAQTAQAFGIEPLIALLSYSSGSSGQGEAVEKVRKAVAIAKELQPSLKLEGPIQYDAAVDSEVAAQKMPGSEVAGKATVLIFPDLNTGNNTYKAVQRETGAIAIGPILQGLKKPVNDLSRGCTVSDIINTVVITAIQAQND
ncbi:phosphate acetyltransferase [Gloeocapsa sp. PCC 73106]|uniref:phosphate acetyltransferase n=1 Tax=Gloeocapsa sp. PCC 73106 TaxID=102232 RepID=UPI0002AC56E6|nr:phosphate acetyltransferase [Gloeocapsa sp. PCC 73106]ELR99844.1 phosphate acetyltransferase [Gloeocapsa sp. PCC 73106]